VRYVRCSVRIRADLSEQADPPDRAVSGARHGLLRAPRRHQDGRAAQPAVIIENKPGAATNLGADFVAKAQPDGYTICSAMSRPSRPIRACTRKFRSTSKGFRPISLTARFVTVLLVNANKLKANSLPT